uniref:Uncharacterized protein MANES_16G133800 n=2 Tax=Rhizophora mucronata TaxID=61149 RepID=A0A2P2LAN7_RHIMU
MNKKLKSTGKEGRYCKLFKSEESNFYQYLTDLQREHCLFPGLLQLAQEESSISMEAVAAALAWPLRSPSKLASTSKYFDAVFLTRCSKPKAIIITVNMSCNNQFRSTFIPPTTCIYTSIIRIISLPFSPLTP